MPQTRRIAVLVGSLREASLNRKVARALERLNGLYEREGVDLGPLSPATGLKPNALAGEVVIAPPLSV